MPSTQAWIGDWVVGGKTVHVTSHTVIVPAYAAVAVGAKVDVIGRPRAPGLVEALLIVIRSAS